MKYAQCTHKFLADFNIVLILLGYNYYTYGLAVKINFVGGPIYFVEEYCAPLSINKEKRACLSFD